MRTINTRQSGRTIKHFDRADNLAQKTKNGLADANRTAEQLQDANAESGVDYAASRIQESEENIGGYAVYGMERIGRWGMSVTGNKLRRLYRLRHRKMPDLKVKTQNKQLPSPKKKSLAICPEAAQGSGTNGKGKYESLSKGIYGLQAYCASHDQVCKGGNQGND